MNNGNSRYYLLQVFIGIFFIAFFTFVVMKMLFF